MPPPSDSRAKFERTVHTKARIVLGQDSLAIEQTRTALIPKPISKHPKDEPIIPPIPPLGNVDTVTLTESYGLFSNWGVDTGTSLGEPPEALKELGVCQF